MNQTIASIGSAESAADVVRTDCDYMCSCLAAEFEHMAGSRLLVTGGAGFLGHYLVQSVLRWNQLNSEHRPIAITVYDNYQRGLPTWLAPLAGTASLTVEEYDVTDPLPSDMKCWDWVIHAASIASPSYYRLHPIETMDANVMGLRRLLDYAVERQQSTDPLRGFLFFSSSEVYGDPAPDRIPTPETYWGNVSFTGPRACYDESKRYGETLAVTFAAAHGIPTKIARPFNNYGPGLGIEDRRVIPDFARDVLADKDIRLLSDGSPTRTFCYVADAVVGYYKTLVAGRPGEAYNIGTEGPEVSIAELAERVADVGREFCGYSGRVVRATSSDPDYLTHNPNRRRPDIDKARAELSYNPSIDLGEGLRRSLLWYRGEAEQGER